MRAISDKPISFTIPEVRVFSRKWKYLVQFFLKKDEQFDVGKSFLKLPTTFRKFENFSEQGPGGPSGYESGVFI